VAEKHPNVRAYVKNYTLGFEIPYTYQGQEKVYLPDFILKIDDGHGDDDLLNLIVETKGQRDEQDKAKSEAVETFWLPGINSMKQFGRWKWVEIRGVYEMESRIDGIINEVMER
jgi:type III restriction enzyme